MILDLFFPRGRCMACSIPRPDSADGICDVCRNKLAELTVPPESCDICLSYVPANKPCPFCAEGGMAGIDRMYAPYRYVGPVRELVHLLKFGHEERAADLLAEKMADSLMDREFDMIIPVPLHRYRKRERGYNQSALLARRVSQHTGIPVNETFLTRLRATKAQSSLKHGDRAANVEKAFSANEGVRGKRILLLDDVRTSGATARACAAALREQEAAKVSLLTAALVWTWGARKQENDQKEDPRS